MTPAEIKADYRSMMNARGETVVVRRYTGVGLARPFFDAEVMAVFLGYEARPLVGRMEEGVRKAIILAADLIDAQFALPVTSGDKLVVRGHELDILAADDSTRRVAGELIAYELQVQG